MKRKKFEFRLPKMFPSGLKMFLKPKSGFLNFI